MYGEFTLRHDLEHYVKVDSKVREDKCDIVFLEQMSHLYSLKNLLKEASRRIIHKILHDAVKESFDISTKNLLCNMA